MFLRIASIALHVFSRACNYPEKWSSNQQGTTSCKPKSTQAPANASTTGSAYGQSHTPEYLVAAQNVHRFVRTLLSGVLCQPGCRCDLRETQPILLLSGRRKAPRHRYSPHRQTSLCTRERLDDQCPCQTVRGNRLRFHACRGRELGALGHHSSQSRWRRLFAPDQTSDLTCRRKVGAFVITIRK